MRSREAADASMHDACTHREMPVVVHRERLEQLVDLRARFALIAQREEDDHTQLLSCRDLRNTWSERAGRIPGMPQRTAGFSISSVTLANATIRSDVPHARSCAPEGAVNTVPQPDGAPSSSQSNITCSTCETCIRCRSSMRRLSSPMSVTCFDTLPDFARNSG